MKKLLLLLPLLALGFGPCATVPTQTEQKLFTIITNYLDVPRFVVFTNTVTATNVVTFTKTNSENVVVPYNVTNLIPYFVPSLVTVTDHVPQYDYQPGAGEKAIRDAAAGVGSIANPAVGGPIAGAIATLGFSLWRSIRSNRKAVAAGGNSTQVIEALREFIKTLPNGPAYDQVLVDWIKSHQMEAGVADSVMKLIADHVTSDSAKEALQEMQASLNKLQIPVPQPNMPLSPRTG